jgi:uncharacterized membrane protein YfcA
MLIITIFLIGFVAGIITGQIGASGVMVIVPGLIMLGYSTFDAIGVSLFADTIASLIVAWTYYQHGNLNLKQGWWIAIGSVLGAQIGSFISPHIPEIGLSNSFGIFLVITALIFWRRGNKKVLISTNEEQAINKNKKNNILGLFKRNVTISGILLGLFIGIITGLLGAGGGVMILLILVFVMDYRMHEGIGTSTLIMAFTAASGAIGHALTGNLPHEAAICAALGAVVGGRISARYANKVNAAILSKIVGTIFAILGIIMLIGI